MVNSTRAETNYKHVYAHYTPLCDILWHDTRDYMMFYTEFAECLPHSIHRIQARTPHNHEMLTLTRLPHTYCTKQFIDQPQLGKQCGCHQQPHVKPDHAVCRYHARSDGIFQWQNCCRGRVPASHDARPKLSFLQAEQAELSEAACNFSAYA